MRITLKAVLLAAAVSFTWPAETQACGCAPIVAAPGVTPAEPAVVVLATCHPSDPSQTPVKTASTSMCWKHSEVRWGQTLSMSSIQTPHCAMAFSPGSAYLLYGTPAPEGSRWSCGWRKRASSPSAVVRDEPRSRPTRNFRRLRAVAKKRAPTQVHGYLLLDDDATSGRTLFCSGMDECHIGGAGDICDCARRCNPPRRGTASSTTYRWENTGSGCHERPSRVRSSDSGGRTASHWRSKSKTRHRSEWSSWSGWPPPPPRCSEW